MKLAYLPIASNTAVIRTAALEAIGRFPPALRWFADSFVCMALAMRHGACVVPEPLALIRSSDTSYSRGMHDTRRQAEVLHSILDLLRRPQFRDIRACLKDCPSNLTVYDPLLIGLMARRPRDWDLLAAYACWKLAERMRHGRLGRLGRWLAERRA
jgi:hypothetical protein